MASHDNSAPLDNTAANNDPTPAPDHAPGSEPVPTVGILAFLLDNRHWWLLPMLLVIVVIFAFAFYVESGTPVIYTRF